MSHAASLYERVLGPVCKAPVARGAMCVSMGEGARLVARPPMVPPLRRGDVDSRFRGNDRGRRWLALGRPVVPLIADVGQQATGEHDVPLPRGEVRAHGERAARVLDVDLHLVSTVAERRVQVG